ncbi:hypothetical protein M2401_006307 [Pseudomonas sp. JUb42]|uniref:hypothetical protein n=1 Tax=Pseudomonas sp. JUb42 TaxID=2940611 RepID=UPI00216953C4|nr:hypothetical protein [Pseudomonas sp. JUb42]MCS3472542.1 hypothetical protein [Pseudomonas sp. JUb42]
MSKFEPVVFSIPFPALVAGVFLGGLLIDAPTGIAVNRFAQDHSAEIVRDSCTAELHKLAASGDPQVAATATAVLAKPHCQ